MNKKTADLHLIQGGKPDEPPAETGTKQLDIGSDVEIGGRVIDDLSGSFGRIVHAEGVFWRYVGSHWEPIPENELRRVVHEYDGAEFLTPGGSFSAVKLNSSRINSIINECSVLCADPAFFEQQAVGINCASGLIRFNADGIASIHTHHPIAADILCLGIGIWALQSIRPRVHCSPSCSTGSSKVTPTQTQRSHCSLRFVGRRHSATPPT